MAREWTEEDIKILLEKYSTTSNQELGKILYRSANSIRTAANHRGITKAIDYQNPGRFSPGHTPWLKGTRGLIKTPKNAFKKGHPIINRSPETSIRIIKSWNGRLYKEIKIAGKWRALQKYLWEKKNGKIPKRMQLQFKDGNGLNCRPSNLRLISRKDLANKHRLNSYDKISRLKRQRTIQMKEGVVSLYNSSKHPVEKEGGIIIWE